MDDSKQEIEDLKTQITNLKIRLRRVEDFLLCIPNSEEYINQNTDGTEDDLLEEAKEVVSKYERASTSLLQRRLQIGYARAARILDELERAGVVGPGAGANPREVLIKK
ncbi:MAG: hypothetical protein M1308_10600 [Actinobacteria bacterium]|nr:hypothetical protein [Actinomycetota bacterium]